MPIRPIKDLSISGKLMLIVMSVCGIALIVASLANWTTEVLASRRSLVEKLSTLAQVVGTHSIAAVTFDDVDAAERVLSALHAESNVVTGVIYKQDDAELARYSTEARRAIEKSEIDHRPAVTDGHVFHATHLHVVAPIIFDDERIGSVYLRAELGALQARSRRFAILTGAIMLAALLIAYVLSSRLRRLISDPVTRLAASMKEVSDRQDFSLRVHRDSQDEIGTLFNGFNDMLGQIEHRDRRLTEHRQQLEELVMQRTVELSEANQELQEAVVQAQEAEAESVAAKEVAEAAARSKDEFLASMSHELRTPLGAVLGLSEVLQEEIYGPLTEKQRSSLSTIENSGRHLLSLISDILDVAKLGAGEFQLHVDRVSVSEVCDASLALVKTQAVEKRLRLESSIDARVRVIQADERRCKQILVNLLSNAVKFTPDGGTVSLTVVADEDAGMAHFSVSDTGIGIDEEHLDRLFQPFVQVDSRLARQYEGTGLGLSLVRQMVELHGGQVSVTSEVGRGSRFTVSLPWRPDEPIGGERQADATVAADR